MNNEEKAIYYVGVCDAFASVLVKSQERGIKLPWIAEAYFNICGKKHFTHDYHLQTK